ncbi:D-aminoacylase [Streptomyces sp. HC44]|uniref:D-aminoacylase n=1 Tax=Streptomyces scabichelini TaxID=2711217 RepID=A0A6G4VG79_9ACTN|nr:D-aminoacylase [Streptomyces scabichelini]NGO13152.1 D-aminoacylase [Streptomyces scabichelini]
MASALVHGGTLVHGATVVDGTGAPPRAADVLVVDGRITAVEPPGRIPRGTSSYAAVDATGLVVCPGFIDAHSHADTSPLLETDDLSKIRQGVTTEIVGNCGDSPAPGRPYRSFTELFTALDERGYVTNYCPLVGHGSLRLAAMGMRDARATPEDLAVMRELAHEALDAGVFGLSSGLIYPPGAYSDREELASLAGLLPDGRVYATHMRDENERLLSSIEETLDVARRADCRVQVSHLKCGGRDSWGRMPEAVRLLDDARTAGVRVTHDVYPYEAASTHLSACLPPWTHEGGPDALLRRLNDRGELRRIRAAVEAEHSAGWENLVAGAGGYSSIMVSSTRSHAYEGRTLDEIGARLGMTPFDAMVQVLREERLQVTMVGFCMEERDIEVAMTAPGAMVGSDGLPFGTGGRPHPRLFGTFPRVLGRYVRERRTLELADAVRRMTSLPADTFSVPGRGRVAVGAVADLVALDPATVSHPGDYLEPDVAPTGISWVMLAGEVVVSDGRWAGIRRGRRLIPA